MAEFNSYLLGKAKKSVGNITLCYTRRKNIAKAKIFSRKDNPTPEMLAQRARMKALVQLSRNLLPVIRKGFVGIGNGSINISSRKWSKRKRMVTRLSMTKCMPCCTKRSEADRDWWS